MERLLKLLPSNAAISALQTLPAQPKILKLRARRDRYFPDHFDHSPVRPLLRGIGIAVFGDPLSGEL